MTKQGNSRRTNGHPGPDGRPNGRGPAYGERGGVPAPDCEGRLRDRAASDDASRTVASAAAFPAAASLQPQAGTDCEAYAEVAPPAPNETSQLMERTTRSNASSSASSEKDKEKPELPAGKYPLPETVGEFVEEIHRKVDITEVWHSLLRSDDEKIRQRAVERLTDLLYKGDPTSTEDPQQIIFDLPRPRRD